MPRKIYGGEQDFAEIREGGYFYIDKTAFIQDWWDGAAGPDKVTLLTRPRRFGKTLMLSTVEHFFSLQHAGRSDLFEGLAVWQDEKMRAIQGTYPVISFSLANIKGKNFAALRERLVIQIVRVFSKFRYLKTANRLDPEDLERLVAIREGMSDGIATDSLNFLCELLYRVHGKKALVLLDEYDTPLQEAWLGKCWDECADFLRNLFNSTFKTNGYLERAILTGITRVSRESMFSDMNNLAVVSTSTERYMDSFGFTESEVFAAMKEFGLTDIQSVREMYDGFTFGKLSKIYNPWSIASYLKSGGKLEPWWSNTSSNAMAGKLVREGSARLKQEFQTLLEGKSITSEIDEQIVYNRLKGSPEAVWSLLLASGYLKIVSMSRQSYELKLTNGEVRQIFQGLIKAWFADTEAYGNFLEALLAGDLNEMNEYMNELAHSCFSYFDTGGKSERAKPERFYHGFVLGLLVQLRDRYILTSNRESGYGRYDVMLEPRRPDADPAFIIEFKVHKPGQDKNMAGTVAAALTQIEKKGYEQKLVEKGIPSERIRKYAFAFNGKDVMIGDKSFFAGQQ